MKFKKRQNAKRYTLKASRGFIQHQLRRSGAGFTLIELLVVLVVLLVVGSILISILFSSLRGTNKVNSIDNVRRNGNYALEQMGKMIRYSRSFDGVSVNNIGKYKTDCIPPIITPTPAPAIYHYVKITGFDGGQTILSCVPKESPLGVAPQIASYSGTLDSIPVNLLDTSTVRIDTCTITCTQSTVVSPPTVTIQFDLSNITSSLLPENQSSIPFQTSVTVRNY